MTMISDVERYHSAPCDSSIAISKHSEAAASRIYLLAFSCTAGEWLLFRVKMPLASSRSALMWRAMPQRAIGSASSTADAFPMVIETALSAATQR